MSVMLTIVQSSIHVGYIVDNSICGQNFSTILEIEICTIYLQIFESKDELCQWVGDTEKKIGFVIMIAKFDSGGRSRRDSIWFGCERDDKEDLRKY